MSISEHWLALGFVAILALMGLAGDGDYQEELNEQAHYCKMIHLYKISNGESGWPDYENKKPTCTF